MATPRRTSARIRARTPGKTPEPVNTLGSLIERDESPEDAQSLDAAVSKNSIGHIPGAFESDSFLTTPSARPEPNRDNMHPSKIQQSTTKRTDEGLILGFSDIKAKNTLAPIENTPSKSKLVSPGFDFKFANAEHDLTAETKRIMDSVREEAAKIKEQMRLERDEQARKDKEAEVDISGRKIAQPRSRFSDAHKAQFSKMDSIANHPSVLKHKKSVPVTTTTDFVPKVLKRTQSKVDLLDDRPENPAPSKRVKATSTDDVSMSRPVSRDGSKIPPPPKLPSAATTPTKASLARSASVKNLRTTSKIPALHHSKSTKELVSPKKVAVEEQTTRSLFGLKKSMSMKSILARPQLKYSDDPIKIAAGTHLPIQEQPLGTPVKAAKRVGFAEDLTSPTPVRPTGLRMPNKVLTPFRRPAEHPMEDDMLSSPSKEAEGVDTEILYPSLDALKATPTKAPIIRTTAASPAAVQTSPCRVILASSMDIKSDPIILASPSPRKIIAPVSASRASTSLAYARLQSSVPNPPRPGDFTFRAERQIKFGPAQTIRTVRPSGIPTVISELPSVPHGMPNKKRARPEDDEDEERENRRPVVQEEEGSPSKKLRVSIGQDVKPTTPRRRLSKFKPASAPGVGGGIKKGLSLSRLNFLARPKNRG